VRTPEDLAAWAKRKYSAGFRGWLGQSEEGAMNLGLRFPTEPPTEAVVAADPAAAAEWIRTWKRFEKRARPGVELQWTRRRWAGFGEQVLPIRVKLRSPTAVAGVAGQDRAWQTLVDRADLLRAAWPERDGLPSGLSGAAAKLARLGEPDLPRLIATVNWFLANPDSGLLARQVPVLGVDTKWLERHTDLVRRLVAALGGDRGLGLRVEPRRFRVRVFDGGDLADFTAPTAELAGLDWKPRCVLLVENRDSMAPLADLPGLVAVHSQGLAAPELAVVSWIARSRVLYWGDLDTHGLRILSLVRQVLPGTESLLMDQATLERYSGFAVTEPAPFRGVIGHLTPDESQALQAIRNRDLRLEQERLPWDHVTAAIGDVLKRSEPVSEAGS
jgi:hypothetical protein